MTGALPRKPPRRQLLGHRGGREDEPGDATTPRRECLERIARIARHAFAAPLVLIGLRSTAFEWYMSADGLTAQERLIGQGLCAAAQRHLNGEMLVVPDLARDARFAHAAPPDQAAPFVFLACHGIQADARSSGLLCVLDRRTRAFNKDDHALLGELTALAEHELGTITSAREAAAAHESEADTRAVMDSVPDGIVTFDNAGVIRDCNLAALRMLGYPTASLIGQHLHILTPPDERRRLTGDLAAPDGTGNLRAIGIETGIRREITLRRQDGTTFPGDFAVSELHRHGERLFIGLLRDISERVRAREELQQQRDFAIQVLNTMGQGLAILDHQGNFAYVNPAFGRLLGYASDMLRGRALLDLTQPDERAKWEATRNARVAIGGATFEARLQRRDGAMAELLITAARRPGGERAGTIVVTTDLTEQKHAASELQRALVELEQLYHEADRARAQSEAILDATDEGIILVNPDDRILAVNRRFSELFDPDGTIMAGQMVAEIAPHAARVFGMSVDEVGELARSGQLADAAPRTLVQRWPVVRELALTTQPVRGADDDFLGQLYAFRDITREQEVERMKGEFISLVSHEMRTPLTAIKGFVEILLGEPERLDAEQHEFLQIVGESTERIIVLVNDLLDSAAIEAGRLALRLGPVDLGRVLGDLVALMRPQCTAKKQALSLDLAEGLLLARGDGDRIAQIAMNLLSNAHKYTPAGGEIYVRATQGDEWVRIDVCDTGIGVTPEEQAHLFDRFYRVSNSESEWSPGTGLGLTIARSLTELHSGQLTVESTPGAGSVFSFTLPLWVPEA